MHEGACERGDRWRDDGLPGGRALTRGLRDGLRAWALWAGVCLRDTGIGGWRLLHERGGCVADVLESVRCLMPDGTQQSIPVEELALGYRASRVRDEGLVVLSATFRLHESDQDDIRARMDDFTQRRRKKQPLELPSAGSTFKRPEGHFAGKLISDAGLKGYAHGGAGVSTKHAGFVVNNGGATAADVHAVIRHVQDEVERQFGVRLEPELRFLG